LLVSVLGFLPEPGIADLLYFACLDIGVPYLVKKTVFW
jgi:hypothetical protein